MAALPLGRVGEDGKAALRGARQACSFDVRAMTYVLNGGKGITHRREEVAAKVREDPVLAEKRNIIFMNRAQRLSYGWKALAHMQRRMRELELNDSFLDRRAYKSEVSLATGADLHDSMFTMTLNGQADEEQKAQWLPLAARKAIIGTYAQTELGHGSNLRSLETTATYDPATESWDLHTPCLTAAKWWPGGLGKTSTHALVMARLVTKGEDHGIAPFMVQLRRQEDHEPMPGITLGDIGPKYGFKTQDNGFMVMDHVRIPRRAMLMRFAKVAPDGTYSKPPHAKLKYGTMVGIRAAIVLGAGRGLGKACTIATRYSFVRKQFASPSAPGEVSVIQYQTQQYKLLPLVATAYALYFTGFYMAKLYMDLQANIDGSDFSTLPEVHAASAGLKALTTNLAGAGIEVARRACGGHGYSELSGLPEFLTDYVAAVTYEGENTLMAFQTARFLIKQVRAAAGGASLSAGLSHLRVDARKALATPCPASSATEFEAHDSLLAAFRHRASRLAFLVTDSVDAAVARGKSEVDARNDVGVELVRASTAHCMVMVFDRFARAAAKPQSGAGVQRTLQRLCTLFGLFHIEQELGEFMEDGYLSPQQAAWVRAGVRRLLGEVLPDSVGLVDAFNFSDYYLNSSLGLHDGDCYRDMFNRVVSNAPLNKTQVADGYKEHLQPLLQQVKWPEHNLPRTGPRSRL